MARHMPAARPHAHQAQALLTTAAAAAPGTCTTAALVKLIPAMEPAFTDLPTAKSFSIWFDLAHLPGRDRPDMAVSLQTDIYFATYAVCESPAQDAACRRWVSETMRRLARFSPGCHLGDSDFPPRLLPRPQRLPRPPRPVHVGPGVAPVHPHPRRP